jgi:hypothetical protein
MISIDWLAVNSTQLNTSLSKGKILKEKKKIGRPRTENPMVHTAVVLPSELIDQLKKDADASGQGLSAEIRQRLQSTYRASPDDAETKTFLAAVRKLADVVARDIGARWFEHSYALAAFSAGVTELLSRYLLAGEKNEHPDGEDIGPPEIVGRTYARLINFDDFED